MILETAEKPRPKKTRIEYELQPGFARLEVGETLDSRQFRDVFERLLGDAAYKRRYNVLLDQRNTSSTFETPDAKESAQMMSRFAKKLGPKMAIVVRTGAQFGMARMFGSFVQRFGVTARPFYAEDDAIEWLSAFEDSDST